MKVGKKVLSLVLSFTMLINLCAIGARAEGATEISTSADLKTALVTGGSIQLTADIKTPSTAVYYDVTKDTTLDLNGHELSGLTDGGRKTTAGSPAPTSFIIVENGATLTVTDTSYAKNGVISATYLANSTLFVIDVCDNSKLVLDAGTVTNASDVNYGSSCVYIRGTGSFEMTGGKISAVKNTAKNLRSYALYLNSTNTSDIISGGTIATTGDGISAAKTLSISGGVFENNTFPGVAYLASGTHGVWAGTTCTVGSSAPASFTAAVTRSGATEYFETTDAAMEKLAAGDILTIGAAEQTVTLMTARNSMYSIICSGSGSLKNDSVITISGTLSVTGTVPAGVVAPAAGYTLHSETVNGTTTYTVSIEDADTVAKLISNGTEKNYLDLGAAAYDSVDGDTIKLVKNADLGTSYLALGKKITLDMNGNTITSASTGNYGAVAVYSDAHITDSSGAGTGAIKHTAGKYGVYFSASGKTCTIENIAVSAKTDAAVYVNNGTVNILSGSFTGVYGVFVKSAATAFSNISGGSFSGTTAALGKGTSGSLSVTGGYFTTDPTAYLAAGKIAGTGDKAGYAFMVKSAETTNVAVEVGETTTNAVPNDTPNKDVLDAVTVALAAGDTGLQAAGGDVAAKVTAQKKASATAALETAGVTVAGQTVTVVIQPKLEVTPKSYDSVNAQLTLDIKAVYDTIATTDPASINTTGVGGDKNAVVLSENQTMTVPDGTPVTITVKIPDALATETSLTIRHVKENGTVYYYNAAVTKVNTVFYAAFTVTHGFSDFTLMTADSRTATVNYNANGGSPVTNSPVTYAITDVATALPIPEKTGYTFDGWTFDGWSGTYTTLPDFWTGTSGSIADKTATASYHSSDSDVTVYTMTFETNGGSKIASISKTSGTTIDLSSCIPTKDGYVFAGWYSDSTLTKAVTSVKLTANTTVYAKWMVKNANPLTSVKGSAYYKDAVLWAVEKGITKGIGDTTFSPTADCAKAPVVPFLYRYLSK